MSSNAPFGLDSARRRFVLLRSADNDWMVLTTGLSSLHLSVGKHLLRSARRILCLLCLTLLLPASAYSQSAIVVSVEHYDDHIVPLATKTALSWTETLNELGFQEIVLLSEEHATVRNIEWFISNEPEAWVIFIGQTRYEGKSRYWVVRDSELLLEARVARGQRVVLVDDPTTNSDLPTNPKILTLKSRLTFVPLRERTVFSHLATQGLRGAADFNKDGKIGSKELRRYVAKESRYLDRTATISKFKEPRFEFAHRSTHSPTSFKHRIFKKSVSEADCKDKRNGPLPDCYEKGWAIHKGFRRVPRDSAADYVELGAAYFKLSCQKEQFAVSCFELAMILMRPESIHGGFHPNFAKNYLERSLRLDKLNLSQEMLDQLSSNHSGRIVSTDLARASLQSLWGTEKFNERADKWWLRCVEYPTENESVCVFLASLGFGDELPQQRVLQAYLGRRKSIPDSSEISLIDLECVDLETTGCDYRKSILERARNEGASGDDLKAACLLSFGSSCDQAISRRVFSPELRDHLLVHLCQTGSDRACARKQLRDFKIGLERWL